MVTYCIVALVYVLACLIDCRFEPAKERGQTYVMFGVFLVLGQALLGPSYLAGGVWVLCMLAARYAERAQIRRLDAEQARWDQIWADAREEMDRFLTRNRG